MEHNINRICILVGKNTVPGWVEEALQLVETQTSASVNLIVRTYESKTDSGRQPDFPFDAPVINAKRVPIKGEYGVRIESDVVNKITRECDIVFQWGNGIIRGDILTEPKFGVLSYHHADFREYRGSFRGFWEWMDGEDTSGVTVQQLTEEIDAGPIYAFKKVNIESAQGWSEISNLLLEAGIPLLSEAIQNINKQSFKPTVISESELGPIYTKNDITLPIIVKYITKDLVYLNYNIYKNTRKLIKRYVD